VVGVKNDGNAVSGSNGSDVVGTSNGTGDGGSLVGVVDALFFKLAPLTTEKMRASSA
jgi:hypothetical protein